MKRLCSKYPIVHNKIVGDNRKVCYFSKERVVIYFWVFGDYDLLQEPLFKPENCDYFIITNQKLIENTV